MMKIKNTLTAGAMVLSAFVAPITMPASAASPVFRTSGCLKIVGFAVVIVVAV